MEDIRRPRLPFRVKVCGVTSPADAAAAVDAGADAIGINFYRRSLRWVDVATARSIVTAVQGRAITVGVFVDLPLDELRRISDATGLAWVQLHGDEPAEWGPSLSLYHVIRAVRVREADTSGLWLLQVEEWKRLAEAVLLDAGVGEHFGGTGRCLDWARLERHREGIELPLVLAGGLTPDNVELAIHRLGPDAVDVATGVEKSPGSKDAGLIRAFCGAALRGFQRRTQTGRSTAHD